MSNQKTPYHFNNLNSCVYYTYRFNPFTRYWEILEHIPELEAFRVIRKVEVEGEAKEVCREYYSLVKETLKDVA